MSLGQRVRVRVVGKEKVADDVAAFSLAAIDAASLPSWAPGAHIEVRTGVDSVRHYSLCGGLDEDVWKIAVLRVAEGGGGSRWLYDQVNVGDTLEVGEPRNNFELHDASQYLFIAGGIGITPILPMLDAADRTGRSWRLVYGGRTLNAMAFRGELQTDDRVRLVPQDADGFIDLDEVLGDVVPGRRVYCCGPEAMLMAIEERFVDRAGEHLHLERFKAAVVDSSADEAFEVEVATSGRRVIVGPGVSIIDALEEIGVEVEFSCREGTCGTCETAVLSGIPDHRDVVLGEEERAANDCMMICVGRCLKGPLVLDL